MREGTCISCGQGLTTKGSIVMPCPACDETIGRCGGCREQAVAYASVCGILGP